MNEFYTVYYSFYVEGTLVTTSSKFYIYSDLIKFLTYLKNNKDGFRFDNCIKSITARNLYYNIDKERSLL